MIWQYSPYFIPYVACGFILVILGITGLRNRTSVCARPYALLMFSAAIWAFATALELSSADIPTQMLAIVIEYPGMAIMPVGWLLFALEYTGREEWITWRNVALLCIVPVITVIMVMTNGLHYLFYSHVSSIVINGLSFHLVTYGPAFWLHAVYSYILILITILIVLQRVLFTSPVYRAQVTAILIATLIPLVVNIILVLRMGSLELIDPTPFALLVAGIVILIGMARFQLLDITPVAQERLLDEMVDGVLVIDTQSRIIRLNKAASRFLMTDEEHATGKPVAQFLPPSALDCIMETRRETGSGRLHEISRNDGGDPRYYEIRCIPLQRHEGYENRGMMLMIRDVTPRRQAEIALMEARKKIQFLSSLTRHDILNQVTGLLLHIDIARETEQDPEIREWLKKQEESILNIQHQIASARDYEDLGAKPPQWMNIAEIMDRIRPDLEARGITLDMPGQAVELYADPLLERVFSNLVENSIRHGKHVTRIAIRYMVENTGLRLAYEDNGIGIPTAAKSRLFEHTGGERSNIGLFLTREILEITGMTITECGVPGEGVRFEIAAGPGKYRIVGGHPGSS